MPNSSEDAYEALQPLLAKLAKAKFSGELRLRFETGQPASAKLIHFLPFSDLSRELVTLEPETEFTLKL